MSHFFYGAIEGFYGRQWSWQARKNYARFFRRFGFGAYIYAPKGDSFLRSRWRELHPEFEWEQLRDLAAEYQGQGVKWGVGLSPLGLGEKYRREDKKKLVDKVLRINELNPDILCVLFDDMRGDVDGIVSRQLEVIADVMVASSARQRCDGSVRCCAALCSLGTTSQIPLASASVPVPAPYMCTTPCLSPTYAPPPGCP